MAAGERLKTWADGNAVTVQSKSSEPSPITSWLEETERGISIGILSKVQRGASAARRSRTCQDSRISRLPWLENLGRLELPSCHQAGSDGPPRSLFWNVPAHVSDERSPWQSITMALVRGTGV